MRQPSTENQSLPKPAQGKRKSSSHDVAALAGVSRTTVSYVLSGRTDIAIPQETRARVIAAAHELKYRSNQLANGLLRGSTRLIGLVVPLLHHSFYSGILQGMDEECHRHGYSILIAHSQDDIQVEGERIDRFLEYRVDGLICLHMRGLQRIADWLNDTVASPLPSIIVDNYASLDGVDSLCSDDAAGAREAVRHLIQYGHRRIGHLRGDLEISTGAARLHGYTEALREAGLPLDERLIAGERYASEDGATGIETLLALPEPPTAVFAANDQIAEGAWRRLEEKGKRIPADIALVGYGDLEVARGLGLTTVDQQPREMGREAVRCLLTRIADPTRPPQRIQTPTTLIVRRSSSVVRNASAGEVISAE